MSVEPASAGPAKADEAATGTPGRSKRPRRWRPLLRALHRDLGYFAVGLTVVYAVSGFAVNHREDWNYNQATSEVAATVGPPSALLGEAPSPGGGAADDAAAEGRLARARQGALVARITALAGREAPPRKAFWRGPDRLSLFFGPGDTDVVDYAPSRGVLEQTGKSDRPLLREMNYLHLNEGRGAWTYVADGFAVVLVFLAISGMFMIKGRKGLVGRGAILVMLGLAVPIAALLIMR